MLQLLEVAGEGGPVSQATAAALVCRETIPRRRRAGLARDVQRHSLPHLALSVSVVEQRVVRVCVQIDESRGDDQAGRVDHARGVSVGKPTHRHYLISPNAHVAVKPRVAGAVDDAAAANQDVEGSRLIRLGCQVGDRALGCHR